MSMNEAAPAQDDLPRWNLDDLYPGMDSPNLASDLDRMTREAASLEAAHKGKVAALTGDELAELIGRYEAVDETLGRVASYASLLHAADVIDPDIAKFYQATRERVTDISTHLLFVRLEINRLDDDDLEQKLRTGSLARYRPWLRDLRALRPHQLSDEIEETLMELDVVGPAAWVRLFDQTISGLRFDMRGKALSVGEITNLLTDPDGETRKAAALSLSKGLNDAGPTLSLITNTLAKGKQIEDKWRHFPNVNSARNISNQLEDEVVEALVTAVRASHGRLSHRYYALKAKWFGQETLDYWDRNAPLPDMDDRRIPWDEAKSIVHQAYHDFSPRLAEIGKRFFDNPWIDVGPRQGKTPGAFAASTVPSVHPYLLLNYHGKPRDVMTLAHELGHGVHQTLAGMQGHFMADTPLTLAETASVFGEMLTFQALLRRETDPAKRRIMLATKVESMLNTVVRQIAFYDFELRLHEARRTAELTADEIGDLWMEAQAQSLGPAIRLDDTYRPYWSYIPHFVHSPFYVYAYAFGDCLVNALYAVYSQAGDGFQERYLEMLSSGGVKRHKELLAPFGLDASDPAFWQKGLGVIEGFIDQLN